MTGDSMLWQKSWWESRIMLWVSLGVVVFTAVWEMSYISHDSSWRESLLRGAGSWNEETRQALPSLNSFQGHVWAMWFKVSFRFMLPYLAMGWATFVPGCASPWTGKSLDEGRIFMLSL